MICGGVWNEMEDMFEAGREKSQTVSSFHELRNIFGGFRWHLRCLCVFVKVGHCSRSTH